MMQEQNLKREERAVFALRGLYRQYGYMPYKMSRFEEYDLYVRNKDFLVSDQIITFSGDRGRLLALKPDVTLSIVKNAPDEPGVVQKVYYNENVYRDYREILQAGLECVGDLGDYEIAEVVFLAAKSLQQLGNSWVLELSHMGLIAAVLADCGLEASRKKQAVQYLRQKSAHQLKDLCAGRPEAAKKLDALCACRGAAGQVLAAVEAVLTTAEERKALEELKSLYRILCSSGCENMVRIDFSVGSDLGYYSGVVFRGYLQGIPTSILSGGQYDRLPRKMGRKARAIGFAIYLDLLQQLSQPENALDVDTLILHDGTADPGMLMELSREASQKGSVLVCRRKPEGRRWKNLIRLEKGVRV